MISLWWNDVGPLGFFEVPAVWRGMVRRMSVMFLFVCLNLQLRQGGRNVMGVLTRAFSLPD